jgi:plastocyanin
MPVLGFLRRTPAFSILTVMAMSVSPGQSAAAIVTIDVFDLDFGNFATRQHVDPTISIGDTIRWVFQEGVHNTFSVTGQAESWQSPLFVPPPGTFDKTFNTPGTYVYYCSIHGQDNGNGTATGMIGRIIVVPEPGLILTSAAIGTAVSGFCVRRRRARR